ncbi:hypothetical protein M3Y95_00026800 [Aphelenchoides besseyi]|nr:hypothetical protein M3Y95_00026800 [Aphelenchoides besseyi]
MLMLAPTLAVGENASMSQRAMPFIFLNMAGEMAYILEQRLIVSLFKRKNRVGGYTQRVSQQRCRQVLSDVLRVVFNDKFLTKLFDPQEQYSRSSLRQYFEKMAHSSVMRLNESSMDRLFDMMTMTVKYQMLSVDEPRYLINITVNHLNGVRQIINYNPELVGSVNYAHELLMNAFKETQTWEMSLIRNALLNHFQDLHIRVSQMMRIGLQTDDGRFFLLGNDVTMPYGSVPPGSLRYYEKGQLSRIATFVLNENYQIASYPYSSFMDNAKRCTVLGDNIFHGDHGPVGEEAQPDDAGKGTSDADEMVLLSKLINRSEATGDGDNFVLNLFENNSDNEETKAGASQDEKRKKSTKIKSTTSGQSETSSTGKVNVLKPKSLADKMQEMDIKSNKPTATRSRGEQMLQMMDEPKASTVNSQRSGRSRSGSRKSLRNRAPSATRKS